MYRKKIKKAIILLSCLLLLISLLTAGLKRYPNTNKNIPPEFVMQDSTIVDAGEIEMKIWDFSVEDGDTVNVIFDGKKIFKKILIKNTPQTYNIGFIKPGRHWLGIEAISEGTIGAATTHVSLSNESQQFEFDIEAHINKPAYRLIIVK